MLQAVNFTGYRLIRRTLVLIQVQSLMYLGRSFQSFGAAALKDLSPNVDSDVPLGASSNNLSFERKLYLVASVTLYSDETDEIFLIVIALSRMSIACITIEIKSVVVVVNG